MAVFILLFIVFSPFILFLSLALYMFYLRFKKK